MNAEAQTSLQFALPKEVSIQDSIPSNARERIVLSYKGPDGSLEAHWVVALLNLSYDRTRAGVRELVQKTFGIDSESEITARVQSGKSVPIGTP